MSVIFIFFLVSCTSNIEKDSNVDNSKIIKNVIKIDNNNNNVQKSNLTKDIKLDMPFYFLGDPYYIEGVEHIPTENYEYKEKGLATFYGSQLHKKKTINNSYNNVTELLGRHKTLPLPSVVKITNLENGLFITVKVNDRNRNII